MKCSIHDVDAGAWGCVEGGPRPPWSYCQHDVECQEGTWCDLDSSVCKPICQNSNACPVGGNCHPAAGNGGAIPGLQICTAYCDPMDAQSCNQTHGPTNCIVAGSIRFDCYASGTTGAYQTCSAALDCGPGLGCYPVVSTICRPWCNTDLHCLPPLTCLFFTPALYYGSTEYGVCG